MAKGSGGGMRLDFASIGGIVVALGAIVGGLVLEGGKVSDISQVTAGMIVLGGTLGAVMINTPMSMLLGALKRLPSVFLEPVVSQPAMIDTLVNLAGAARRNGMVSLEAEVDKLTDPFLKKALSLAIDGTDSSDETFGKY